MGKLPSVVVGGLKSSATRKLRVFVPSKGRADRVRTYSVFPDATVVVHDEDERRQYKAHNPGMNLVVSNTLGDAYGLTRQREWICRNLADRDEWFVFADDNIRRVDALIDPYYILGGVDVKKPGDPDSDPPAVHNAKCVMWRKRFCALCTQDRFFKVIAPDTIAHCKSIGAHLAGFSLTDNVLFRIKKFKDCAYVIGKLMLWHNTLEIPFCHEISMEDFYHTAMHLKVYGACVVNTFCFPRAEHYQKGGMGTYEERVPIRRRDVQLLMQRFPGMFNLKTPKGRQSGIDLKMRVTTAKQLQVWREFQSMRRLV